MAEWSSATDWDSAQAEEGVVHESSTTMDHTDASLLKKGYAGENPPFASTLVFWWPFHEDSGTTANDVIGTNDGTISGATVEQPGLLGTTCYSFDKVDDVVSTGSPIQTIGVGTDFTISLWFNPDGVTDTQELVLQQASSTDRLGISINRRGNGHLEAGVYDGGFAGSSSGPITATQGWIHAVYVYESATTSGQLYIDGAAQSGTDSPNFSGMYDGPFYVGRLNNGNAPFGGLIGEVKVFDRQLSGSEVQALYEMIAGTSSMTPAAQTF